MSWRRWSPPSAIASAASSAHARGPPPGPARARRPPGLGRRSCGSRRRVAAAVPAWKTSAARLGAASRPSIGSPRSGCPGVAPGGEDDRRPPRPGSARARRPRDRPARAPRTTGPRSPRRRGEEDRPERAGEPGQDHLGLRVAEAGVALEEDGPVGGQDEPGVEEAAERRPAPGELGRGAAGGSASRSSAARRVGQVRDRAVGAHPAGVRAAVAVARGACGRGRPAGRAPRGRRSAAMTLTSRP